MATRERLLRTALDAAGIGLCVVDREGRVVASSGGLGTMLGRVAQEIRGMRLFDHTHPDDAAECRRLWREVLEGKRSGFEHEQRFFRKDGTILWSRLAVRAICDADGSPVGYLATVEDISVEKAVEAAEAERFVLLTPRQRQVLALMSEGLGTDVIAQRLSVARATVRNHVYAILKQLSCHSRLEAVALARHLGLL